MKFGEFQQLMLDAGVVAWSSDGFFTACLLPITGSGFRDQESGKKGFRGLGFRVPDYAFFFRQTADAGEHPRYQIFMGDILRDPYYEHLQYIQHPNPFKTRFYLCGPLYWA